MTDTLSAIGRALRIILAVSIVGTTVAMIAYGAGLSFFSNAWRLM